MLDKRRLLSQLQLPSGQDRPFEVEWRRHPDLFEDGFFLRSQVAADRIQFDYRHQAPGLVERSIWSFGVELSSAGRAHIAFSEGIDPPLRTIFRGAEMVQQALAQLQANPVVSCVKKKPAKRAGPSL